MKTIFIKSLCLILLAMAGMTASAQKFEVDGINYRVLSEAEGTVEITNGDYSGDVVIPAEVSHDGGTYRVTTIGDNAFYGCSLLSSISMPSVTSIGMAAFRDCSSLTSVSMPSVTTINVDAFWGNLSLVSIDMPCVKEIGDYAFALCESLSFILMPSVVSIGNYAFEVCSSLTSLVIPASTTSIGDYVFTSCGSLTSIYCHWKEPLECDPDFADEVYENATLYVPVGTTDAYRSVYPWSEFANIAEKDYSGIGDATATGQAITVKDGAIVITGGGTAASAPLVEIYSAGGACIWRGTKTVISGLPQGIYVVKAGDTVQKVAL